MKEYKLYNGEINLLYDDPTHKYYLNDELVTNMTAITGIISNKDAMVGWSAKMCKLKFLEKILPNTSYSMQELDEIAKDIWKAPRENKESAGDIGTKVHHYIEDHLQYDVVPNITDQQEANAFNEYMKWYNETGKDLEVISLERKVYSKKYNYTGTTDALFKKGDEYIMYDWKTSSGIYHPYLLQVTGYAMAIEEELGYQIKKGVIANFPKKGKMKLCEFDIDSTMRDNFLALLKLYLMQQRKV